MITRRRVVIALGAGAFAAPLASFAQEPAKIARIGFLGAGSASVTASWVEALRTGLRDLGYIEGKNIVIEYRWADGKYERLADLAGELVRLKVDVLVTHGTSGTRAAKQATTTIPIVMAISGDAVGTGLVASLARPGGNITGSTAISPELMGKLIELLKETFPRMKRVAVLLNPNNAVSAPILKTMEIAARSLKLELQRFEVRSTDKIESAFSAMVNKKAEAVVIHQDPMLVDNIKTIADLASKERLPSIGFIEFCEAGGLMAYSVNRVEMFRRAGYFVDRILKGTRPADLPVEQPTKFELVINLKTAKTLGIKFPNSIMVQATKVIE